MKVRGYDEYSNLRTMLINKKNIDRLYDWINVETMKNDSHSLATLSPEAIMYVHRSASSEVTMLISRNDDSENTKMSGGHMNAKILAYQCRVRKITHVVVWNALDLTTDLVETSIIDATTYSNLYQRDEYYVYEPGTVDELMNYCVDNQIIRRVEMLSEVYGESLEKSLFDLKADELTFVDTCMGKEGTYFEEWRIGDDADVREGVLVYDINELVADVLITDRRMIALCACLPSSTLYKLLFSSHIRESSRKKFIDNVKHIGEQVTITKMNGTVMCTDSGIDVDGIDELTAVYDKDSPYEIGATNIQV